MAGMLNQVALGLFLLATLTPTALQAGARPLTNPPKIPADLTNSHFKMTGPGIFQLGGVTLNSTNKTLSFAASVNLQQGPVEYLLVSSQGKVHESILKTEVEPYHIHLGMLLLNLKGARPDTLKEDYSEPVPGDPIWITITWQKDGGDGKCAAEDLVWDGGPERAMAKGEWTYSGSRVIDGTFIAQRDRSLISIIGDIDALVNNPRSRRDQDDNWQVNTNTCPPLNTPVQVIFHLKKEAGSVKGPR